MKLTKEILAELIAKHVYKLSEEELRALAFLCGVWIEEFEKNDTLLSFKMGDGINYVYVEAARKWCIAMGRKKDDLTGWGKVFSFAESLAIYRNFFCRDYSITLNSPNEFYTRDEQQELALYALSLVQNAA